MQLSSLVSALALSSAVSAKRSLRHIGPVGDRLEALDARRLQEQEPRIVNDYVPTVKRASSSSGYQYLTNKTQGYLVDGTAIPDVEFDVGESYAGLIPLNDTDDELFFWFFPSTNAAADKEILIWLNGGVCF